jgi:hypothetical protein
MVVPVIDHDQIAYEMKLQWMTGHVFISGRQAGP